jgi:hypothetical protein
VLNYDSRSMDYVENDEEGGGFSVSDAYIYVDDM